MHVDGSTGNTIRSEFFRLLKRDDNAAVEQACEGIAGRVRVTANPLNIPVEPFLASRAAA